VDLVTPRLRALLLAAAVAGATSGAAAAATAPKTVVLQRGQHVYKGTANTSLGTLALGRTARLTWRHPRGGRLRLLTSGGGSQFALLTTASRSGSVALRAGTYRGLRVQTRRGWRITVTTSTRR
jgi:hypothetical protein